MIYLIRLIRYLVNKSKKHFSNGELLLMDNNFKIIEDKTKWKSLSYHEKDKIIDEVIMLLKLGFGRKI